MIIDLKFKNWMSFRNETEFSLVATEERRLKNRVPQIRKSPVLNISPVAVLYGGNAAGKTNLFKLLAFLQRMVVRPLRDEGKEFPFEGFALSPESSDSPLEITFTFLAADDKIYTFHIVLTKNAVLEESLSMVKISGETLLYSRKNNAIEFPLAALEKDEDAKAFARIIGKNQFFLGVAGLRVSQLQTPCNWFRNQLTLIETNASYRGFENMFSSKLTDTEHLAELLKQLDTGICKLDMEEISFASLPPCLSSESEMKEKLNNGDSLELNLNGLRFWISKKDDKLTVKKMVSYHEDNKGNLIKFELKQESEGSLRLLDILPAFIDLEHPDSRKVYVIDELDRSWHYELSHHLLGIYLSHCSKASRAQLIFSTHDLLLMDQSLFRRDEMWTVERNVHGASDLSSLSCNNIRYDKDIRKLYLQGALGGIPRFTRFGSLLDSNNGD